jgi:hypothetical protein
MAEETAIQPLYEEVQQPVWPIQALTIGSGAAAGVGLGVALTRLGLAARFGVAGLVAGGVGLALGEFLMPMRTTLLQDEVQIRFGRRTRFRIPLRNIVRAYARDYKPLAEFGGWGIRNGAGGRAFNMRGERGVQLVLRSGQRVLIGTERPDELAEAIRRTTGCEGEGS